MLNAGMVCSRDVDLAEKDESVYEAAKRMQARRVGTLIVLDDAKKPCGIVTDRDLVVRVLATSKDPETAWLRDVVSSPVHVVRDDAAIEEAVRTMRAERCRRVVVVDTAGRLVGILSLDDVLSIMAEQMRAVAALLESEAPHALDGELRLSC